MTPLEYERKESVYGHSTGIKSNEKGNIFFQIPEKRITPTELQALIKAELPSHLPPSHPLSERLVKETLQLVELAKEHIHSLSSFFFMIETSWKDIEPEQERDSFYSHYHPPRTDKNSLHTLSYFKPIAICEPVNEEFTYINLLENNEYGKPYFVWNNPHQDLINEFETLSQKLKHLPWNKIKFSSDQLLEIKFDSCNLLHNLKNLSSNIFLVLVINDVEFKSVFNPGELKFKYL